MREAGVKERGARQDDPHRSAATPAQAGVDPRARGEPELALLRHQEDPARAEAAHRVRGSVLPQHRRVLRQRHRHLHDPRRHLHAPLSVLRRGPRPAAGSRCGGAAASRGNNKSFWGCPTWSLRASTATICATAGPSISSIASRRCRKHSPKTTIEVLVPDFRGRLDRALEVLKAAPPDVMNHNLETVPRLYRKARPGGDYAHSLRLLQEFKKAASRRCRPNPA